MIPAKISNLNPVQVTYDGLPEPYRNEEQYLTRYQDYIASVENVIEGYNLIVINGIKYPIYLNNSCFIEPTTEGKCEIIKLN